MKLKSPIIGPCFFAAHWAILAGGKMPGWFPDWAKNLESLRGWKLTMILLVVQKSGKLTSWGGSLSTSYYINDGFLMYCRWLAFGFLNHQQHLICFFFGGEGGGAGKFWAAKRCICHPPKTGGVVYSGGWKLKMDKVARDTHPKVSWNLKKPSFVKGTNHLCQASLGADFSFFEQWTKTPLVLGGKIPMFTKYIP